MKTISRIPVFNCVEPSGWQLRALPSGCENCLLFIAEEWLTGDQRQNEKEMPSAVTSLKAMAMKAPFFYKSSPKTPSSMLEILKSGVWLKMLFKLGVVAGTRDFSTLRTRQGICLCLSITLRSVLHLRSTFAMVRLSPHTGKTSRNQGNLRERNKRENMTPAAK